MSTEPRRRLDPKRLLARLVDVPQRRKANGRLHHMHRGRFTQPALYAEVLKVLGQHKYGGSAYRTIDRMEPREVTVGQLEEILQIIHRFESLSDEDQLDPKEVSARLSEISDSAPYSRTFGPHHVDGFPSSLGIVKNGPALRFVVTQVYDDGEGDTNLFANTPSKDYVKAEIWPLRVRQGDKELSRTHVVLSLPPSRPNDGVVMLAVDPNTHFDTPAGRERHAGVALVGQLRFCAGKFLVEAPRGFAKPTDPDTRGGYFETAKRELAEETGLAAGEDDTAIVSLGRHFTDTGRLSDAPHFLLMWVDRTRPNLDKLRDSVLEAPLWFKLSDFYRAVLSEFGVPLDYNPWDDDLLKQYRPDLTRSEFATAASGRVLEIRDCFTHTLALRALPHLRSRLTSINWDRVLRAGMAVA